MTQAEGAEHRDYWGPSWRLPQNVARGHIAPTSPQPQPPRMFWDLEITCTAG